jgi:lipopolysaccharide transport system permease protein
MVESMEEVDSDAVVIRFEASRGWVSLRLRDLWAYRELLYFLVWRDIKVRYKQTVIGAAWTILQPLLTMLMFAVIFGHLVKVPSEGLPYPIFAYTALLPWSYFSSAMARSSNSLLSDAALIGKIYFPRLILPLSGVVSPLVDFFVSLLILVGMILWYGYTPSWSLLTLPLFLLLALLTALAVGLWLSPLNVWYHDIGYTIPFLIQIWMYASPVVYPVSLVPERWRPLYGLNPIVGVIEGFRWAVLGKATSATWVFGMSTLMVLIMLLAGGLFFFKRMERTFADVV